MDCSGDWLATRAHHGQYFVPRVSHCLGDMHAEVYRRLLASHVTRLRLAQHLIATRVVLHDLSVRCRQQPSVRAASSSHQVSIQNCSPAGRSRPQRQRSAMVGICQQWPQQRQQCQAARQCQATKGAQQEARAGAACCAAPWHSSSNGRRRHLARTQDLKSSSNGRRSHLACTHELKSSCYCCCSS